MREAKIAALLCGLASMPAIASAQTNVESNAGVQLDFLNPGARSLALGGAFVGLADDATAALTNPAGLKFISRREFSLEGRYWSFSTPFTSGGRLSGNPRQLGIDLSPGLTTAESNESAAAVSFLSFVYPRTRWAVAAYRQQLASFDYRAESSGPFYLDNGNVDGRLNPYTATLSVDIARYGVSGSYRINDSLSVGAGMYMYDFKLNSETKRFGFDANVPQFYAAPNYGAAPARLNQQSGSEQRLGFNVGLMATPHPAVRFGAVFRQGGDFEIETRDVAGSSVVAAPGTFSVPDVFGVGAVVQPIEALKIAVDYNRVRYSRIADTFSLFFRPFPGYAASAGDFRVDDANQVHAGVEYVLLGLAAPVALRAGTWFDPDHTVRFEPSNAAAADPYALAVFRPGRDVVHGTFGAGLGFGAFEINLAADISSRTRTASLSTVVRF